MPAASEESCRCWSDSRLTLVIVADSVKVRLQTQSLSSPQYSGVLDCASKIMKTENVAGFYKGTLTPLLGIGACVSIQFGALEAIKRAMASKDKQLSLGQLYVAGAGSGLANSFLSGPIEHVRIRLQVQSAGHAVYSGPLDFAKNVYSKYGLAGIYKGQGITLVREIHGYGIYFAVYEYLVQREMKEQGVTRSQVSSWKQLMFGAVSGYTLWTLTYPIVFKL